MKINFSQIWNNKISSVLPENEGGFITNHKTSQPDLTDHAILSIEIEHPNSTDSLIGSKVGLSRESVSRRKKRSGYQSLVEVSEDNLKRRLNSIYSKAVLNLEILIDDPDPRVKLAAIALVMKYQAPDSNPQLSKDSLRDLVRDPEFCKELLKIPGAGHKIFMSIIKKNKPDE